MWKKQFGWLSCRGRKWLTFSEARLEQWSNGFDQNGMSFPDLGKWTMLLFVPFVELLLKLSNICSMCYVNVHPQRTLHRRLYYIYTVWSPCLYIPVLYTLAMHTSRSYRIPQNTTLRDVVFWWVLHKLRTNEWLKVAKNVQKCAIMLELTAHLDTSLTK